MADEQFALSLDNGDAVDLLKPPPRLRSLKAIHSLKSLKSLKSVKDALPPPRKICGCLVPTFIGVAIFLIVGTLTGGLTWWAVTHDEGKIATWSSYRPALTH